MPKGSYPPEKPSIKNRGLGRGAKGTVGKGTVPKRGVPGKSENPGRKIF